MNPVIVMKFGGSSLADAEKIEHVADIVVRRRESGSVVVVVSAMGKTTDALIEQARRFTSDPDLREMDMLLTAGERISASLLTIALNARGVPAVSLTGSQAGIVTDDNHTNARILEVRPYRVVKALEEGKVVVVGGFQGVSFNKEVTTLGRGGSDISAVALASALDARECEIYSDVAGVFAADPRIIPAPVKIPALGYQEMQELGEAGAKVLHPKAVEFAKLKGTVVHCKNTFAPETEGTIIANLEGRLKPRIVGVATEEKVVLVHVYEKHADTLDTVEKVIAFAEERNLRVKQISFHRGHNGGMVGSFIIPEKENYHLSPVLQAMRERFGPSVNIHGDLAAVSLVGAGITERQEFLLETIRLLKEQGIGAGSLHTSSFRISLLVPRDRLAETARVLYERFFVRGEERTSVGH